MSRYKGGTRIAEGVSDLASHLRCLRSGAYRPDACLCCGGLVLHVHDYLERKPIGELDVPFVIPIIRYICAAPSCRATWRILPAFLARHLWRVWPTVERTVPPAQPAPSHAPAPAEKKRIPKRTVRRWRERLASSAKQLVVLLATSGGALLEAMAMRAGLASTRFDLVDVHAQVAVSSPGRRLADLAALVHRLERGLRLM